MNVAIAACAADGNRDIYVLPLFDDRKPVPVMHPPFLENEPHFSFDGKWLAFNSNESGTNQVYVISFPTADQKGQISTSGNKIDPGIPELQIRLPNNPQLGFGYPTFENGDFGRKPTSVNYETQYLVRGWIGGSPLPPRVRATTPRRFHGRVRGCPSGC